MSESKMEQLKNKIRRPVGSAVHSELIDASPVSEIRPVREQKKKFEELYRRDTIWLKNEVKEQLDLLSKDGGRGEKTRIINAALESYFENHH